MLVEIELYPYKYRTYGTIGIYILKGLASAYVTPLALSSAKIYNFDVA